jgi:hypothetical protein
LRIGIAFFFVVASMRLAFVAGVFIEVGAALSFDARKSHQRTCARAVIGWLLQRKRTSNLLVVGWLVGRWLVSSVIDTLITQVI